MRWKLLRQTTAWASLRLLAEGPDSLTPETPEQCHPQQR